MNANTTTRIARFFALPFVTAGLLASAFFFSAAAHAGTYSPDNSPRPASSRRPTPTRTTTTPAPASCTTATATSTSRACSPDSPPHKEALPDGVFGEGLAHVRRVLRQGR